MALTASLVLLEVGSTHRIGPGPNYYPFLLFKGTRKRRERERERERGFARRISKRHPASGGFDIGHPSARISGGYRTDIGTP